MPQSEVARLLKQIEQEYQASKQGLEGLTSGTARHDFIQKRTENIGLCHEELTKLIASRAFLPTNCPFLKARLT